ncbi:MAG: metallophosphoesterase, partial [Desulfobacterales bacterium]|nr:metallophosphoesterase [Desulfobacterales bacterium]
MAHKDAFQILHISDLHINDDKKEKFGRSLVLDPLIERVKQDKQKGIQPEIVVVTGDVAYKGVMSEYELAKVFFDELLSGLNLSDERLFIVPGNHDVNRNKYRPKDIPAYENVQELNIELENEDYRGDLLKGLGDYFDFIKSHYPHLKSYHKNMIPFINMYHSNCGKKIGIVGLNSAWMCRKSPDEKTIAIGEFQVKTALQELKKMGRPDQQINLFHHPLSWLWATDRNRCRTYFNNTVLLTGHLHDVHGGYVEDLDGSLFEFQAGGAYLGSEESWPSRFHYITFDWDNNQIRLDFRRFVKDKRKWSVDGETGDDGKKSFNMSRKEKRTVVSGATTPQIPETYCHWINECCAY